MKPYSKAEIALIRRHWPDVAGLAAKLGRTAAAIRTRARKLGLGCPTGRPKRPFTAAERDAVRQRYPAEGALPLARDMGRTAADLVSLAQRLGVRFNGLRRWSTDEDERLIQLCRGGASEQAAAKALRRSVTAVAKRKELLGLTRERYDPAERRRQLVRPHIVRRSSGRCVGTEVRWARERLALGEHGWPPDLNPKEIAILESLRRRGPQTRRVLARSIGEPVRRDPRKVLMAHGGTSAVARLMARDLVTRCFLNEGRQRITIYTLTRLALDRHGTFPSVESFNAPIASAGLPIACSSRPITGPGRVLMGRAVAYMEKAS